ncbi:MAG: tRNA dimethylallyltransferase [Parcubacteria group bacterium GW2011_GWB1_42_9]|nr:MAG: tRNA dimethylallyltransferase [Parcubacteria group bacterium GW2011_GWB1_42_9]
MPKKLSKILVILGPTASGKTALSIKLAKKINGEIISADSRQVYRGMDIGTGKVTKKEMVGIPHHLLDVADPKRVFSVAQYQKLANKVIADILKRDKMPIICGGTGLYIDSVIDGLILPAVPPNKKLRRDLAEKSVVELFAILKKLDPRRAKNIDSKNPVRLIRAIEIAKQLGTVPTLKKSPQYDCLKIGIDPEPEILRTKIHDRLIMRLRQGMMAEVKKLHSQGVSWQRLEDFGLEYRYLARLLHPSTGGKITKSEMIDQLEKEIVKYSKRQMTWFKRDKKTIWVRDYREAEKILTQRSADFFEKSTSTKI